MNSIHFPTTQLYLIISSLVLLIKKYLYHIPFSINLLHNKLSMNSESVIKTLFMIEFS